MNSNPSSKNKPVFEHGSMRRLDINDIIDSFNSCTDTYFVHTHIEETIDVDKDLVCKMSSDFANKLSLDRKC